MTEDQQMRLEALRLANNTVDDEKPSKIVERAEKFYDFLKGPEEDQPADEAAEAPKSYTP